MGMPCVEYVTIYGLQRPQMAHERENLLICAFANVACMCGRVRVCMWMCVFESLTMWVLRDNKHAFSLWWSNSRLYFFCSSRCRIHSRSVQLVQ